MNKQIESVNKFNERLSFLENTKIQKQNKIREFFRGIGSVLNIRGSSLINPSEEYNLQLYSREDLTPEQKDAIAITSDWQRIGYDFR